MNVSYDVCVLTLETQVMIDDTLNFLPSVFVCYLFLLCASRSPIKLNIVVGNPTVWIERNGIYVIISNHTNIIPNFTNLPIRESKYFCCYIVSRIVVSTPSLRMTEK